MKITRVEITKAELCEIVKEYAMKKFDVAGKKCDVYSFDDDQLTVIEFDFLD